MVKTLISVELHKSPENQSLPLHNRWHPSIPAVATVSVGDSFRVECLDWTGGQIKNNDNAEDIRTVELTRVHYLSGPIAIKGAQPGDLLVVDILDIGCFPHQPWGFTGIFDKTNGGGFLTDYFPHAFKAIWDIQGDYATSRHIPHVKIKSCIHPGLIGCAPSEALLKQWNKREAELVSTNPGRVPPLANLPSSTHALVGALTGNAAKKAAEEGARTVPPREHGGNCDIKNLSKGCRIFFPVYIPNAHLSMGDLHFSQGDGEISFCGAIEMAGWIELKVDVIKNGVEKYGIKNPIFHTPQQHLYAEYLTFEGISVENNKQYYLDAHIAYKQACLNAIEYLKKFGYSGEQSYIILSALAVEGRISGIVDIPNVCATLALPLAAFDFNILPNANGPFLF